MLFVHGAGTPAEVAFDVPYKDYSWMAYLAQAGFDVFSMDMTGYGRSTRPPAMNDPCNLSKEQQAQFVPQLIAGAVRAVACRPPSRRWVRIGTTSARSSIICARCAASRRCRSSRGRKAGRASAGYAAQATRTRWRGWSCWRPPTTVAAPLDAPNPLPPVNAPMNAQSHADFTANWDRQVGCPDQYEPAASAAVWSEMLASDPVGATWGTGVRRAPQVPTWGFNQAVVTKMQTPFLMVAGVHDKQVAPERVRELYADLGSKQKVFIDLGVLVAQRDVGEETTCCCSRHRSNG